MSSSYDPRISAYFGDAVLRAGFVAVPHLLLRHYHRLGLSANQAMFVLQLMESTWDLAEPPRTTGELAQRMGVDKRTIRRYSEEVAALGLVSLFDQFDEHGAQIGNGYDLSPLFARLAELAPEGERGRAPTRTPRPVRAREASDSVVQAPGQNCPPPPRTDSSAPAPDKTVRLGEDQSDRGGRIAGSGLKGNKNNIQQQEAMMPAAATSSDSTATTAAGYALGLGVALSADDVARSAEVLAAMGVEQPVRGILAPALAPCEVWALRVYALLKRWGIGLVIAQVYDRHTRRAKAAEDIPAGLIALGRALDALAPAEAEATLERLVSALGAGAEPSDVAGLAPGVREAASAAWPLLGRLAPRQAARASEGHAAVRAPTADDGAGGELWSRVQHELAGQLPPAEFDTWLRQTSLLALGDGQATVGAGNTFAREQLATHYRPLLERALEGVLGHGVDVEVVIA